MYKSCILQFNFLSNVVLGALCSKELADNKARSPGPCVKLGILLGMSEIVTTPLSSVTRMYESCHGGARWGWVSPVRWQEASA